MKELKLVAKGGALSLTGDAVNYSLSYVFLLIAANFLGASVLGAYYWCISLTSLLGEVAEAGLGQGLIYFGPKLEDRSLPLFRLALVFAVVVGFGFALVLCYFAPVITARAGKPELVNLLRFFALTLPLSLFWPMLYKYCVARFQIVPGILYGDILRPILRVSSLAIFIFLGWKLLALLAVEFSVALILVLVGMVMIIKLWGKEFLAERIKIPEAVKLFAYSLPFLPLNLARGERVIIIITGFFLAAAQVGVFGVAVKVAAISQVILTGLNFVFRPMVTKLYTSGDLVKLNSIYKSVTRWIFILTLPLSYLLIFYPGTIMSFFGNKFAAGAAVLSIVALGYLFEYGTSATQVIINMTGRSWLSLMNQLIYFAIVVVLAISLIPRFGIIGAAWSVALGIVVINLLRLYQSCRIIGFSPYSYYLIKPIAAVLLAGLALLFMGPIWLIVVYLAIYCLLVWLFGLNSEDRALLAGLSNQRVGT